MSKKENKKVRKADAEAKEKADAEEQLIEKLIAATGYSKRVIKAARKVGCSEGQIMALSSEEVLWSFITKVDPKLIPKMSGTELQKAAKAPVPVEEVQMVSREKEFTIELSPQSALTWKRGDYEQSELDRFVNRNGIKNLVRVEIIRGYVPNKTSKYETEFTIHYKEPK